MRVALVHDWFTSYAGSERVVEQLLHIYPQADVHTLVDSVPDAQRGFLQGRPVKTSFIQRLPGGKKKFRRYIWLMPMAIEQFDMAPYDLVLSSSHAVAKGVITGPNQKHICYCHSPMRYAWDLQHDYLRESGLVSGLKSWMARWVLHRLRQWDTRTANGVDTFIANSNYIAQRIWKVYRREAHVIYPPVDTQDMPFRMEKEDFYVVASRMVPYKKIPLVVEAFRNMPDKRLVVLGDGPDFKRVQKLAKGQSHIQVMGYQPSEVLHDYMARAKALVFAAEEDFGILPVEAQACGTPVIAYGRGGVTESVQGPGKPKPTGLFFPEQTPEAIQQAVETFEKNRGLYDPYIIRKHAEQFSVNAFQANMRGFLQQQGCLPEVLKIAAAG